MFWERPQRVLLKQARYNLSVAVKALDRMKIDSIHQGSHAKHGNPPSSLLMQIMLGVAQRLIW